jgi:hypothetical protein
MLGRRRPLLTTVNNLVAMVNMEHNPNPLLSMTHLTNLNLNNVKMIEAMGLKVLHRGALEWRYFRTKFHENLPSGPKVTTEGHRETDW